jgi:hypothetical protein
VVLLDDGVLIDRNDNLAFLVMMKVALDDNLNLGISISDRRSIDGRESEEEGRDDGCDKRSTHFESDRELDQPNDRKSLTETINRCRRAERSKERKEKECETGEKTHRGWRTK